MKDVSGATNLPRCAVVLAPNRRPLLKGIGAALADRGKPARLIEFDEEPPTAGIDLVVVGPKTPHWLEQAKLWHLMGIHVSPNPYVVEALRNRKRMRELLRTAGFGIPRAWEGTVLEFQQTQNLSTAAYPLVVKGLHDHGNPVIISQEYKDLRKMLEAFEPTAELSLETIESGTHGTAYFIGSYIEVLARKPFGGEETEVSIDVPMSIRACITKLSALSGLRFGKVDIILDHGGQPVAVDLGTFPKFLNVPEAATKIARLIAQRL